jgi:hypothetical protein
LENKTGDRNSTNKIFYKGKVVSLNNTDALGHIKSIVVCCKLNIGLLQAIGSDKSVDLGSLNIVDGADSVLNLSLVGSNINNEGKCVVVLDTLDGVLIGKRVRDDLELVVVSLGSDSLAGNNGGTLLLEGLGAVKVNLGMCAGSLAARSLLKRGGLLGCSRGGHTIYNFGKGGQARKW